jgi:UDP-N-acetylglucosamine enolpyruvyl transferase
MIDEEDRFVGRTIVKIIYRVARGFDDICGKLKNSSLSIVPD